MGREREEPVRVRGLEAMRALAHPVRVRMLHLLREEPASASELARRLNIRYGSARFHLQLLVRAGIAHLAGERRKRGGHELLFAVDRVWVEWDPDTPREVRSAVVRAYVDEVAELLDRSAPRWHAEEEEHHVLALHRRRLSEANARRAVRILEEALARIERLPDAGPRAEAFVDGVQFFRDVQGPEG